MGERFRLRCWTGWQARHRSPLVIVILLVGLLAVPWETRAVGAAPGEARGRDGPGVAGSAPSAPVLVTPADGSEVTAVSTTLSVQVSDPDGGPLTVSFYAKPVPFTVVPIPDTQAYSDQYPEIFDEITTWIVENWHDLHGAYAVHVGDIVEHGMSTEQWEVASAAMAILEDPVASGLVDGVPYGILPGNHDTLGDFDRYFGPQRFEGRWYYAGHYPGYSNHNNYSLYTAGGMDFIQINLENNPRQDALDWADALLKTHSDRRGIVASHSVLLWRQSDQGDWFPSGLEIFEQLGDNPNMFMILGGHSRCETKRVDVSASGTTVYTLVADYTNEANGNIRLVEFSPAENLIHVRTYSPHLQAYETDANSQFDLFLDMSNAGFAAIDTVAQVASGGTATTTMDRLVDGKHYEWYVTVSDGEHVTTGPVWSFDAALGAPVPAAPQVSISADGSNAQLAWPPVTKDTGGAPLTVDHYQVWRSALPFFAPGSGDSLLLGTPATPGWTDVNALANATSGYYVVRAVAGDRLSTSSNRVGEFPYPLTSGEGTFSSQAVASRQVSLGHLPAGPPKPTRLRRAGA